MLGAGHGQLRTISADTVDRVLLAGIESDEVAALHPFLLDELELPFDIGLNEQIDQATIDTVVLERAILEMRAVLDAAPDQAVPPHSSRPFQGRRARVTATQVRAEGAPQALVVACIREIVATLRVRRDFGVILVG